MTGRYCPKHEEWCPSGECRWCEPAKPEPAAPKPLSPFARATRAMIAAAQARIAAGATAPWTSGWHMLPVPPPGIQRISCKCGVAMLDPTVGYLDETLRYFRHTATGCGAHVRPSGPGDHYPACPLKGIMAADPAKDLAAGCTCVPFP